MPVRFNQLIVIAALLMLISSCKKNEDSILADVDGNIYTSVTIGTQVWMVENLKTTKYNDGTVIPNVINNTDWISLTTGAYCDNDNNPSNSTTYGRLYNWYVAASTNLKNACPTGWHVPSNEEWTTLMTNLGGQSVAGGKLKEKGTTHWDSPNTGATNETGFTALPGGFRGLSGKFQPPLRYCVGWLASEYDFTQAWGYFLTYDANSVSHWYSYKSNGRSIRCLKD